MICKERQQTVACTLAIVLAVGALPLMAEVLGRLSFGVWSMILPSLVIPAIFAVFHPRPLLIVITMLLMYIGEWSTLAAGQRNLHHSIVEQLQKQPWPWIAAPIIGLILALLVSLLVRRVGRFRWPMRNYYSLLLARPTLLLRKYWPALSLLMLGATLDTITTINSMLAYGTEGELHPAMQMLSQEFGVVLGVSVGTCVRLMFVLFVAAAWRKWTRPVLITCGIFYCLAAASNHFLWL